MIDTSTLYQALQELPERIYNLEKKLVELKRRYHTTKELMEKIEVDTTLEVALETTPDGKPKHPNETRRVAEVKRRLSQNQQYAELERAMDEIRWEMDRKEAQFHLEYNRFNAARACARLMAAEMLKQGELEL